VFGVGRSPKSPVLGDFELGLWDEESVGALPKSCTLGVVDSEWRLLLRLKLPFHTLCGSIEAENNST
jgi:hypothetical protein